MSYPICDLLTDTLSTPSSKSLRLNDRYTLGNELGRGGLSTVFEVRDDLLDHYGDDRQLAIKLPLEKLATKEDVDAFMYAEYAHLSHLSHPNIIKSFDFGVDSTYHLPYIVLERLHGSLLSTIPPSQLERAQKNTIAKELFETIRYLHSQQIVHADINPTNIMCLPNNSIKLFDFGISINVEKKKRFELNYQKTKAYNPQYAAPELIKGAVPDKKSDLFSLAVVLYELYSNRLPYTHSSIELEENPISLTSLSSIPFLWRFWFKKALSPIPSKRVEFFPSFLHNFN